MNTSMKIGVGVIIVLLLIVGAYAYSQRNPMPAQTGANTYAWQFTDKGTDAQATPHTEVALLVNGSAKNIGTYEGTCSQQNTDLLPNEKTKAICWFAGGGKEIGVFEEGGMTLVKVGDVDEGDAETAGFRGNFQTVLQLQ